MTTNNVDLGTAPDSWGIWFADDPNQVPADRFLDEVAEAGYEWIEIGAFGYLSTDPAKLSDDLGSRRLRVSGILTLFRRAKKGQDSGVVDRAVLLW